MGKVIDKIDVRYGYKFSYSSEVWVLNPEGKVSGFLLDYLDDTYGKTQIVVNGWELGQWNDEYLIMKLTPLRIKGKLAFREWIEHVVMGKMYSLYFRNKDNIVSFSLAGWMDKYVVREFEKITRTFELIG